MGERMVCPFSKGGCQECPIYRGRHINLCFYRRYPANGEKDKRGLWSSGRGARWELPDLPANPTWLVLNQFEESAYYERREE